MLYLTDRLVPFVLILVILEEILPLVVIYAPFMLPSTTILPSQAERIYKKQEEKKIEALAQTKLFLEMDGRASAKDVTNIGVKELDNDLAWTVCRYALSSLSFISALNTQHHLCAVLSRYQIVVLGHW